MDTAALVTDLAWRLRNLPLPIRQAFNGYLIGVNSLEDSVAQAIEEAEELTAEYAEEYDDTTEALHDYQDAIALFRDMVEVGRPLTECVVRAFGLEPRMEEQRAGDLKALREDLAREAQGELPLVRPSTANSLTRHELKELMRTGAGTPMEVTQSWCVKCGVLVNKGPVARRVTYQIPGSLAPVYEAPVCRLDRTRKPRDQVVGKSL